MKHNITIFSFLFSLALVLFQFSCAKKTAVGPAQAEKVQTEMSYSNYETSSTAVKMKRTLGQLLFQAYVKPEELICLSGRIDEVSSHSNFCYLKMNDPKQFCDASFVDTGVVGSVGDPIWIKKGYCDSGLDGTSGEGLSAGSTIFVIASAGTVRGKVEIGGASEDIRAHVPYSPIFDVAKDGHIAIGGEWTVVKMSEKATIDSDDFLKIARNILSGKMLRHTDYCGDQRCANGCASRNATFEGRRYPTCAEGLDCYYATGCAQIVAEEPDVCYDCGETNPVPPLHSSERLVLDGGASNG